LEVRSNASFFSVVGDIETWDNNPGGEVASFSFFFFWVNRVKKDGAVVARNGEDEDDINGVKHDVAVLTNNDNRVDSDDIGGDDDANNGADNNDDKNTDDNNNNAVFTTWTQLTYPSSWLVL
jgi:hypothetical protein